MRARQAVRQRRWRSPGCAIAMTPVTPIIGARKIEQLKDNLERLEVQLSTDQLERLNEVSKIDMGFPHNFFDEEMVQAFAFVGLKEAIDAA